MGRCIKGTPMLGQNSVLTLQDFPIRNWHEHTREVFSVHWNYIKKDTFASGSWDHSIKIVGPLTIASSVADTISGLQKLQNHSSPFSSINIAYTTLYGALVILTSQPRHQEIKHSRYGTSNLRVQLRQCMGIMPRYYRQIGTSTRIRRSLLALWTIPSRYGISV